MDHVEQIDRFELDLLALIDRYSKEFDLPYASIIGCLQLTSYNLCKETDDLEKEDKT